MAHSLPYFYDSLLKVKTVENVNKGEAMKDFIKGALVIVAVLALFMGIRFALFMPLHNEIMGVNDAAPFAAADK